MKKRYLLGSTLALSTFATAVLASEPVAPTESQPAEKSQPVEKLGEIAPSPYGTFQVVQTEDAAEAQVTSVSQLSDVQPTDWAFQALQSLVERYGCIAGYPDGTFRGNRAATRYELAAALNACLDQISDRFATKEDLETVKALQEEFKAELATLKGRVDGLEARTATLEAQQFSTTTKLVGEAIFQVSAANNARAVPGGGASGAAIAPFFGPIGDNFTFNQRATLSLLTSFTGKDLLITSLQQGSYSLPGFENLGTQGTFTTSQGGLAPSYNQVSNGSVGLYYLGYRFPIFNDKGTVFITATGGELSDFTDTLNPLFDSDGQGSLSGFGIRNPIYRHISGRTTGLSSGTGAGANFNISDQFNIAVGYLAPNALAAQSTAIPGGSGFSFEGNNGGLFGSDYSAIAQLTYKPTKTLGFGLTYVRSYQNSFLTQLGGGSGTFRAGLPFLNTPTSADSAGLEFTWQPSSRFAISGWFGATFATAQANNSTIVTKGDNATILNGAIALAFPDLLIPGNLGGLIFGVEPQVTSSTSFIGKDPNTNFHIEALYRVRINDNISITPGVIAIINPEGNSANDPIVIGTVRTTFTF
jgi:Carbohydrate-selective porin, OprB family/S-layer homology domain